MRSTICPPFALKASSHNGRKLPFTGLYDVIKSLIMGPHRLQLGDAGGGRETGNLFGVAFSTDVGIFEHVGCEELSLSDHDLVFGRLRRNHITPHRVPG